MTDKKQDKVSKAGAVELDEGDLDKVQGGATYLKIGDIDGESLTRQTVDSMKLDGTVDKSLSVEGGKYPTIDSKTLKI